MDVGTGGAKRLLTVVIASRCDDARAELLRRACDSVRSMANGLSYSIVVVANGAGVSTRVVEMLNGRSDTHVVRLRSGSYPLARRVGAEMADGEFLAFLDDDDELIPDTLSAKIACFREHPHIDVLVTDGLSVTGTTETRIFQPPEGRSSDLVEAMMHVGWGAGALTLRAASVELWTFDAEFRHLEWTLTALQLASRYRVGYLDRPTYRYYEDTPNSLWKSADHILAAPEVWRRLRSSYAGTKYESTVCQRYGRVCHQAAIECTRRGLIRDAWRFHLSSVASPGGAGKLPFSAKLLLATLYKPFARRTGASLTPNAPLNANRK